MKNLILIFLLIVSFAYAETPKEIKPEATKQEIIKPSQEDSVNLPRTEKDKIPAKNTGKTEIETSYLACGCGCCGGVEPVKKCIYHSKGDDLNKIIQEDGKKAQSPDCPTAGCSMGTLYSYCDE